MLDPVLRQYRLEGRFALGTARERIRNVAPIRLFAGETARVLTIDDRDNIRVKNIFLEIRQTFELVERRVQTLFGEIKTKGFDTIG